MLSLRLGPVFAAERHATAQAIPALGHYTFGGSVVILMLACRMEIGKSG